MDDMKRILVSGMGQINPPFRNFNRNLIMVVVKRWLSYLNSLICMKIYTKVYWIFSVLNNTPKQSLRSAVFNEIAIFRFHFTSTRIFMKLMNFEENLRNNEKELFPVSHQIKIPRVAVDKLAMISWTQQTISSLFSNKVQKRWNKC